MLSLLVFFAILILFVTKLIKDIVIEEKLMSKMPVRALEHLNTVVLKSNQQHLRALEVEHHEVFNEVSHRWHFCHLALLPRYIHCF